MTLEESMDIDTQSEDSQQEEEQPQTTHRGKKMKPLDKTPTREELLSLSTPQSSLFEMQLQSLVEEVTLSPKSTKKLEDALHSVKSILDAMKESTQETPVHLHLTIL